MSLDIGMTTTFEKYDFTPEYHVSIDDGGYYWFLYPLITELRQRTGKYIDLYGYAEFHHQEIHQFIHFLNQAEAIIQEQPDEWQVHIGKQTIPVKKELYETVNKRKYLQLIAELRKIAQFAEEKGGRVVCLGD